MSTCEKCWTDAHRVYPYGDITEEYRRLIEARKDNPCTPEEQAGEEAGVCKLCGRKARHQWTGECMACHDWAIRERGRA
jgi:hypothetical protein